MKTLITKISILMVSVAMFLPLKGIACDEASATLTNSVDNGNGTYTYTIDVCTEYNGLEGSPDDLIFTFFGGVTVSGFTPASYSTTSSDVYTGSSSGNVLTYATGEIFPGNSSNTLCNTFTITISGNPSSVDIRVSDYPSAICTITIDGLLPLCEASETLSWE